MNLERISMITTASILEKPHSTNENTEMLKGEEQTLALIVNPEL